MLSACSLAADRAVSQHQPSIRQPAHRVRRQRQVFALHVGEGVAVGEAEARGGGETDRKARAPVRPQPLQQLPHVVRRAGRHSVACAALGSRREGWQFQRTRISRAPVSEYRAPVSKYRAPVSSKTNLTKP